MLMFCHFHISQLKKKPNPKLYPKRKNSADCQKKVKLIFKDLFSFQFFSSAYSSYYRSQTTKLFAYTLKTLCISVMILKINKIENRKNFVFILVFISLWVNKQICSFGKFFRCLKKNKNLASLI